MVAGEDARHRRRYATCGKCGGTLYEKKTAADTFTGWQDDPHNGEPTNIVTRERGE